MLGFIKTLQRIWNCDGVNPIVGSFKHILWQRRKIQKEFRVELSISNSKLIGNSPIGVVSLVNSMGMYDYNNMNLIQKILNEFQGVFIDVGANIGSYTLIASEVKEIKVFSIEPHPETYRQLVDNINLNSRMNAFPFNIALSDKKSELFLMEDEKDSTKNRVIASDDHGGKNVRVPAKTLDGFCQQSGIEPTLVKIDVEGHEENVLNGFREKSKTVQLMIIENGNKQRIKTIMSNLGFIGPFYVHYKKRKFLRIPHRAKEDPVFFFERSRAKLEKVGFVIGE